MFSQRNPVWRRECNDLGWHYGGQEDKPCCCQRQSERQALCRQHIAPRSCSIPSLTLWDADAWQRQGHTVARIRQFPANQNVHVHPLPANPTDMNPIEHIWDHLVTSIFSFSQNVIKVPLSHGS